MFSFWNFCPSELDEQTKRVIFTESSGGSSTSPSVLYRSGPDQDRVFPKVAEMVEGTGNLVPQDTM